MSVKPVLWPTLNEQQINLQSPQTTDLETVTTASHYYSFPTESLPPSKNFCQRIWSCLCCHPEKEPDSPHFSSQTLKTK